MKYGDKHVGCSGVFLEGERKIGVCTKCTTTCVPMCESWCELDGISTHYICRKLKDLEKLKNYSMTYELAKQLKDAGFPIGCAGCNKCLNGEATTGEVCLQTLDCKCHLPTLSELIEACGEKFCELVQQDNYVGWHARGDDKWPEKLPSYNLIEGSGKTPEEAVAKLWLDLNSKENYKL